MYIYSYYLHPSSVKVLQTTHSAFNSTMLLEKQPVVIQDDPPNLSGWMFKQNGVCLAPNSWNKNVYKHLVLTNTSKAPKEVIVSPATAKRDIDDVPINESAIIAFQVSPQQSIILPFHWSCYIADDSNCLYGVGLHDIITYFLPA